MFSLESMRATADALCAFDARELELTARFVEVFEAAVDAPELDDPPSLEHVRATRAAFAGSGAKLLTRLSELEAEARQNADRERALLINELGVRLQSAILAVLAVTVRGARP